MKLSTLAIVSSLVTGALAFESTVPCVMWSSKDNYLSFANNDQLILKNTEASSAILKSLSSGICDSQLIAFIDQPGLHRSDVSALETVKKHSQVASSHAEFEYIADGVDINELAKSVGAQCGSDVTSFNADDIIHRKEKITKVVTVSLPEKAEENDEKLSQVLTSIQDKSSDNYVVIYTSSTPKEVKRSVLARRAPSEKPTVNLPIFAKYQLFSPAIFMGLGVVLLFIFIAGTGITWLVGIQTPLRFEGKQKKN